MLESYEIAEELLTVSEVAAALKVPVSWVYERTRRSGPTRFRISSWGSICVFTGQPFGSGWKT